MQKVDTTEQNKRFRKEKHHLKCEVVASMGKLLSSQPNKQMLSS
jgi:hypothetical protein